MTALDSIQCQGGTGDGLHGLDTAQLLLLSLAIVISACGKQSDLFTIVSIALHPTDPNILYVATNESAYKARDRGMSWERISTELNSRRVLTLATDPKHPATVYAGTMEDAVYKSPDGGQRRLPNNVERRVFVGRAHGRDESDQLRSYHCPVSHGPADSPRGHQRRGLPKHRWGEDLAAGEIMIDTASPSAAGQ
jgi:hypothetical protein